MQPTSGNYRAQKLQNNTDLAKQMTLEQDNTNYTSIQRKNTFAETIVKNIRDN